MQAGIRRERQRGAVAVFAAVALLAMLTAALVGIEIGRMYAARAELQKQANIAALDAARMVGGCAVGDSGANWSQEDVTGYVNDTLLNNGATAGAFSLTQVELGRVVDLVGTDEGRRSLEQVALAENAEAVRVTLQRAFPAPLVPLLPANEGRVMTASATAQQAAVGSVRIGSSLLGVSDGVLNTLLSRLVDGSVDIGVLGYQQLLNTSINLTQLATGLDVSVEDLSDPLVLSSATPVFSEVLDRLVGAVGNDASAQARAALQALAGETTNDAPVPLDVILHPVGDIARDVPFVSLGDLIMAMAMATHEDEQLALPLSASLLGVNLNVALTVLEPPQISPLGRAGQASASTAQLRLSARLEISTVTSIVNVVRALLGPLVSVSVDPLRLGVDVVAAPATAWLDRVVCPRSGINNGKPAADLSVSTGVANVKLGSYAGSPASMPPLSSGASVPVTRISLSALLLGNASVNVNLNQVLSVDVGDNARHPLPLTVVDFDRVEGLPEDSPPVYRAAGLPPAAPVAANPQTVATDQNLSSALGSLAASLDLSLSPAGSSGLLGLLSGVLTALLNGLVTAIEALILPLLTGVGGLVDLVLDPLLKVLGVNLGEATAMMDTVAVDQPTIISMDIPLIAP